MSQVAAKLSNLENGNAGSGSGSSSGGVIPFSANNTAGVVLRKMSAVLCKIEGICADALSENYGKKETYFCVCPVACFPFGNSIIAYFSFDDNYSAGTTSVYAATSYNEEQYIRYSNSFGRFDKMSLIYANTFSTGALDETAFAQELYKGENAQADGVFGSFDNCLVDKDSREQLSVTAQLNFVTANPKIEIFKGFIESIPFASNNSNTYRYVVFTKKQNKFDEYYSGSVIEHVMPTISYSTKTRHIRINSVTAKKNGSTSGSNAVPFIVVIPTGLTIGEGYGIIDNSNRLCLYIEKKVYDGETLPPIYLMFRRRF